MNEQTYRVAGFWMRLWAYLIDLATVFVLTYLLIHFPLSYFGWQVPSDYWLINLMFIGIFASVYFVVMTKVWRQTLGKMIFGLFVIRADGYELSWSDVLFREWIGRFLSQFFGLHLGYIWIIFHPRKQGWHDMIEETYVVHDPELTYKRFVRIKSQEHLPSEQV